MPTADLVPGVSDDGMRVLAGNLLFQVEGGGAPVKLWAKRAISLSILSPDGRYAYLVYPDKSLRRVDLSDPENEGAHLAATLEFVEAALVGVVIDRAGKHLAFRFLDGRTIATDAWIEILWEAQETANHRITRAADQRAGCIAVYPPLAAEKLVQKAEAGAVLPLEPREIKEWIAR